MQTETIIIGQDEYTVVKMNVIEVNRILMRLNKIVLPVLGGLTKAAEAGDSKKKVGILDADLTAVTSIIVENLTEEVMETIVFPLFLNSRVYHVEKKIFIKDAASVNMTFTSENLLDLYELIWEVLKLNFTAFFTKVAGRFGGLTALAEKVSRS